mmetsp:Transcript_25332/g.59561  ORF Transcript_25332/g.59561 Transcript_25332/m.59561 type:complete len:206 (-) Transcript_25332:205-822(-)
MLASAKKLLKTSFWMVEVPMPSSYLHGFVGAAPTRAELALIFGGGFFFALMPLIFYAHEALPADGWQRGLYLVVNFYLCASAIGHLTDDTYAFWSKAGHKYLQAHIGLNGIALVFLVVTMPQALVICILTYLLATATAIAAMQCPNRLIKPICMTGASISSVVALGVGASSAAAPSCIMYVLLTTLSLTIQHANTLNGKELMPQV